MENGSTNPGNGASFSMKEGAVSTETTEKLIYCNFCKKSQHEVSCMITSLDANICDECIDLCVDTLKIRRYKKLKASDKNGSLKVSSVMGIMTHGVRVSSRPAGIIFEEKNPLLLMDRNEHDSICVEDVVYISGSHTPWNLLTSTGERDLNFENELFKVVGFVELEGRTKKSSEFPCSADVICTFAILSLSSGEDDSIKVCTEDSKVLLFWTGCLKKKFA